MQDKPTPDPRQGSSDIAIDEVVQRGKSDNATAADAAALLDAYDRKLAPGGEYHRLHEAYIAFLEKEREIFRIVAEANRGLPPGAPPFPLPGRSVRFSPGLPPTIEMRREPRRQLIPTEVRSERKYRDVFIEYGTEVGGIAEFNPPPLHRAIRIPPICRGGPSYDPDQS